MKLTSIKLLLINLWSWNWYWISCPKGQVLRYLSCSCLWEHMETRMNDTRYYHHHHHDHQNCVRGPLLTTWHWLRHFHSYLGSILIDHLLAPLPQNSCPPNSLSDCHHRCHHNYCHFFQCYRGPCERLASLNIESFKMKFENVRIVHKKSKLNPQNQFKKQNIFAQTHLYVGQRQQASCVWLLLLLTLPLAQWCWVRLVLQSMKTEIAIGITSTKYFDWLIDRL